MREIERVAQEDVVIEGTLVEGPQLPRITMHWWGTPTPEPGRASSHYVVDGTRIDEAIINKYGSVVGYRRISE